MEEKEGEGLRIGKKGKNKETEEGKRSREERVKELGEGREG
jgi:hypothetical protein